jgi:hypothetical protein
MLVRGWSFRSGKDPYRMSASQSNLSAAQYGYDFVVATTQGSINSTMKWFLSELTEPVVTVCYLDGEDGAEVIAFDELLKLADGADPFEVSADADPNKDPALVALYNAGFLCGFRAQLGLPPMSDPDKVPDIVELGSTASSVTYNMLCAEFDVVQLDPGTGRHPKRAWLSVSQEPDVPWIFQSKVDLRLEDVADAAYASLPEAVRQQIKNLSGSAFSIQQLLFDLDNAALATAKPTIIGVTPDSPLADLLDKYFLRMYFAQLQSGGEPVLGCTISQPVSSTATMALTDMNLEVSPFTSVDGQPVRYPTKAQQDLTTLDYLCMSSKLPLPPAVRFTWNWIDEPEETDFHGVVAINRIPFVFMIYNQLLPSVQANCYKPSVRVSLNGWSVPEYSVDAVPTGEPRAYVDPVKTTITGRDLQVLQFSYHGTAHDTAGAGDGLGEASLDTYYDATVYFSANVITIEQNQKFYMQFRKYQTWTRGYPINIKRVDTCTIDVDQFGQLVATMATPVPPENHPSQEYANPAADFFIHVNSAFDSDAKILQGIVGTMLNTLPFTAVQYYVFPGGRTFSYKSAAFSTAGDLTSHILYASPDQMAPVLPLPAGQVAGGDRLNDGQWLANDSYLVSPSGKYTAFLKDDGKFVLTHATDGAPDLNRAYWSATDNHADKKVGNFTGVPCHASMQSDGNFVLYNGKSPLGSGPPYWAASKTALPALGSFAAVMQDDANFVVYRRDPKTNKLSDPLFASGTDYVSRQG